MTSLFVTSCLRKKSIYIMPPFLWPKFQNLMSLGTSFSSLKGECSTLFFGRCGTGDDWVRFMSKETQVHLVRTSPLIFVQTLQCFHICFQDKKHNTELPEGWSWSESKAESHGFVYRTSWVTSWLASEVASCRSQHYLGQDMFKEELQKLLREPNAFIFLPLIYSGILAILNNGHFPKLALEWDPSATSTGLTSLMTSQWVDPFSACIRTIACI